MRAGAGLVLCVALLVFRGLAQADDSATYATRNLTPETELKAEQAALRKCRASGWQAAVAEVDRRGVVQVTLRDR